MRLTIMIIFGIFYGSLWAGPGTASRIDIPSDMLGREWPCKVYLPGGYDSTALRYPVIYLLHGSGGDENEWDRIYPVLDSLIAAGIIPPLITVAPASGTSWWVDGRERFESAFFSDLIPAVDLRYRTIERREGRCVAGFSMGGYGALRYALARCDMFAAATLLSPALYAGQPPPESSARSSGAFGDPFEAVTWSERNYPAVLEAYLPQPHRTPIYILAGDDDWNHPEGFEYNIEQQAVLLYGLLNRRGDSPAELRIVDGGHSWRIWQPGFIAGIQYMMQFITLPDATK